MVSRHLRRVSVVLAPVGNFGKGVWSVYLKKFKLVLLIFSLFLSQCCSNILGITSCVICLKNQFFFRWQAISAGNILTKLLTIQGVNIRGAQKRSKAGWQPSWDALDGKPSDVFYGFTPLRISHNAPHGWRYGFQFWNSNQTGIGIMSVSVFLCNCKGQCRWRINLKLVIP